MVPKAAGEAIGRQQSCGAAEHEGLGVEAGAARAT